MRTERLAALRRDRKPLDRFTGSRRAAPWSVERRSDEGSEEQAG